LIVETPLARKRWEKPKKRKPRRAAWGKKRATSDERGVRSREKWEVKGEGKKKFVPAKRIEHRCLRVDLRTAARGQKTG